MTDARHPSLIAGAACAGSLSAVAALGCYFAAGAMLGLLFGALALAALIAVPISVARPDRAWSLTAACATATGTSIIWLLLLHQIGGILRWMSAVLILASFLAMLCAAARALSLARIPSTVAAAITVVLAIAWLTWPIWLTGTGARSTQWLVAPHPLLALNAIALDLGVWTQQPLMYRLTTLGQDVPYRLPMSILACVLSNLLIAGLLLCLPSRSMPAGDALSDR